MTTYTYHRIAKLAESLTNAGVETGVIDEIMAGGDKIGQKMSGEKKAEWFRGAMERLDGLVDFETRRGVRENCACCLGGKRLELSRGIARRGGSLEERVAAANETTFVFGHSVTLEPDGRIVVRFAQDESVDNRCVCLPQAQEAISASYCLCCGGHIKHHLQIALGQKLEMNVRSSALSSAGKQPCSFWFRIVEN